MFIIGIEDVVSIDSKVFVLILVDDYHAQTDAQLA